MKTNPYAFSSLLFAVVLTFAQPETLTAQPKEKDYYPMDYSKSMVFIPGDNSVAPFYISDRPVTNKEYILYLIWTNMVFSNDYPEVLFAALPGFNASAKPDGGFNPFADSASFRYYLDHSDSFVSEYIFNPYYLNSAVIGVSWEQAILYCHWLSDRYNEYSLIKNKVFMLDFYQVNEQHFSTEPFIFRRYEGHIREVPEFLNRPPKNGFSGVDYYLRPSFHLATRYEMALAYKQYKLIDCFCASTRESEFLKSWLDFYLPVHKGYLYFFNYSKDELLGLYSDNLYEMKNLPPKISEWCFDTYLEDEGKNLPDIYRKMGYNKVKFVDPLDEANQDFYPSRDQFGRMPYIIIGENTDKGYEMIKAPVNLKKNRSVNPGYIFDHNTGTVVNRNGDEFTCFRYAVNAIKK